MQRKSDGWKNEQVGVLDVLDSLCLKKCRGLGGCNEHPEEKIAEKIKVRKGDYVMPLKHNHRVFSTELEAYFHKAERDMPDKIARYQDNGQRARSHR